MSEYADGISRQTTDNTVSLFDNELKHRMTKEEAHLNKRFMDPGKSGYHFSRMSTLKDDEGKLASASV